MPPLIRGARSLKDLAKPQLESNALEVAEARLEELRESINPLTTFAVRDAHEALPHAAATWRIK